MSISHRYRSLLIGLALSLVYIINPGSASAQQNHNPSMALRLAMPDETGQDTVTVYYDFLNEKGELSGGSYEVKREDLFPKDEFGLRRRQDVAGEWSVETIYYNGPSDNRVDIVVLGDGYTDSEMGFYASTVADIMADFFDESPFDVYQNYFNVHRVDVVSNESGVDEEGRDTALGMYFNDSGNLTITSISDARDAAASAPAEDEIFALANSDRYGGSGGQILLATGHNDRSSELVLHEFGHTFGHLADEYWYAETTYQGREVRMPNCTIYTNPELVQPESEGYHTKWYRWLPPPPEEMDPSYEGCGYEYGLYRPTERSKMRTLGHPFEEINTEQFIFRIYELVSPIDEVIPGTDCSVTQYTHFAVVPLNPTGHTLDIQWLLDGEPIPGATASTFTPVDLDLPPATYTFAVQVVDNTSLVADEGARAQLMSEVQEWTMEVDPDYDPFEDCNDDDIPDECEPDCNGNGSSDLCDIWSGISNDCNGNLIPDECEPDCNGNGVADSCDLAEDTSEDVNANEVPDECEHHETIYVNNSNCPRPGSGTELYPFCKIQDAIDSAGDGLSAVIDIVVANGTYIGPGNRDLDFDGRSITLRSKKGPAECIIDCEGSQEDPHRGFYFHSRETSGAHLDGFTIINGSADQGGAIYLGEDVEVTVRNCVITGNSADSGGGIYAYSSYPTISNCKITGNTATEDGGGLVYVGSAIAPNPPPPDPSIRNCTIAGNLAANGGGLAIGGFGTTIWLIHNCTITGNRATSSGGGISFTNNNLTLQNCILWGDEAPIGHEIAILTGSGFETITLTVDYSDVEDGVSEVYGDPNSNVLVWGGHNIDADPLFVDPGLWDDSGTPADPSDDFWVEGDIHLTSDSRCIDTGDPNYDGEGLFDIDGEPRVFNDFVDMGADEFHDCNDNDVPDYHEIAEGTSADCNDNGVPDMCDVATGQSSSIGSPPPFSQDCNDNGIPDECEDDPCPICDLNGDGQVDESDKILMRRCLDGPYTSDVDCEAADLNGYGRVDERDWQLFILCYEYHSGNFGTSENPVSVGM